MLHGRHTQTHAIDALLTAARSGDGGALVCVGGLGSGKTALLDYAASRAEGMTVLRVAGVPTERDLAYAALHMLLRPLLDRVDELPAPQSAALRGALGLAAQGEGNRFLVGLATLSLLAERAETEPVLCLVDGVRWLDRPSLAAMLFAARRLGADRVAMLFATTRLGEEEQGAVDLPRLELSDLDRGAATALLDELGVADPGLRERLITVAEGNPLALRELARTAAADPAVLPPSAETGPPGTEGGEYQQDWALRLRRRFAADYDSLPAEVRQLLLVAAAEGGGDVEVIRDAARRLSVDPEALVAAAATGYVELVDDRLTFPQEVVRSAIHASASAARQRAVHAALAAVYAETGDADRRVWHAARAATGTDDATAEELAAAARRAVVRGGQAAAVDMLHRAAWLSSRPAARNELAVEAAELAGDSGLQHRIPNLVRRLGDFELDALQASRVAELRAEAELLHGSVPAARAIITEAARAVAAVDVPRSVIMVTHLANAAIAWGETAWVAEAVELLAGFGYGTEAADDGPGGLVAVAAAACRGIHEVLAGDPHHGAELVRAMVEPMRPLRSGMAGARVFAATLSGLVADDEIVVELVEPLLAECRAQGMVGWLPTLHAELAPALTRLGRFRDARASVAEGQRVGTELGQHGLTADLAATGALLAAVAGEPIDAEADATAGPSPEAADGPTPWPGAEPGEVSPWSTATRRHARALAALAAGDYAAADALWTGLADTPALRTTAAWAWAPDQVEAAVRTGDAASAAAARELFARWASGSRREDLAAVLRRCDALLAAESEAEAHFEAAQAAHEAAAAAGTARPFDAARTALLYGEWSRRHRDRAAARRRLRHAAEEFERLGATGWASRARLELRATGETRSTRAADPDLRDRLTPQELQVVKLAATGATNRDIAAQLFLSPRTVGHHLYKAFPKLGVANRAELARVFADDGA